ncbi:hypothetical protein BS47DRAFT_53313 [Hydnum rufescens UP504]|uniref:Uncharacterized protein n=1 Tax=Hydnum rufescens UP504 TaxID=1448309 RepID=A0A9P6ARF3_9AGAM|nr:hypothetical protein BS47DRAFT_53313 [Hydnum rufescens UP504]
MDTQPWTHSHGHTAMDTQPWTHSHGHQKWSRDDEIPSKTLSYINVRVGDIQKEIRAETTWPDSVCSSLAGHHTQITRESSTYKNEA